MKIIPPPPIADLDELLDVVLHPEKLVARLKQMQEMRDAITEALGVHGTKAKADELLHHATIKHDEAHHAMTDASEMLETCQAESEALRVAMAKEHAEWHAKRQAQQQELVAREKTCQAQAAALDAQSGELTVREGALHAAQDATTKQKAKLDEEHDKMMKRKALLSEIN